MFSVFLEARFAKFVDNFTNTVASVHFAFTSCPFFTPEIRLFGLNLKLKYLNFDFSVISIETAVAESALKYPWHYWQLEQVNVNWEEPCIKAGLSLMQKPFLLKNSCSGITGVSEIHTKV